MNYYERIKDTLINNELTKKVKDYSKNKSDLESYYKVGKLIIEAQGGETRAKYGDNLIKEYSNRLMKELNKKYSYSALSRMRQFYLLFINFAAVPQQLTWSHYVELLPLKDINKINYYIDISIKQNLSYRKLKEKIKNKEYERLSKETKTKIINQQENNIEDFIKNPVIINNKYNYTNITENYYKN